MAIKLLLFIVLLALTAFFVATEFAIIRMRASRVQQLVAEGARNARAVEKVTSHLDGYLSACQLGITITALGLGWLGEPTVEQMLHPLLQHLQLGQETEKIFTFLVSFLLVTYLHVVLGELAPKTIAIIRPEWVSKLTAKPIIFFYRVMYPFIWLLNGSANRLVRLAGFQRVSEHEAHTEEEIRTILSESYESGQINRSEYGYVNRIFAFDERLAREVMVPRTDMVCLYVEHTREQNIAIMREEQYTRFPVARGDKDNIVGILNTKRFFLYDGELDHDVRELLQPALSMPEVMPINKLLKHMQQEGLHMVILLDEYGGTSGLLTLEDIIEEIVGEIRDEFDEDEEREIQRVQQQQYIVNGKALIADVNEVSGLHLPNDEADTIGGWLYHQQPELPEGGTWRYDGARFTILDRDAHRIRRIEIFTDSAETEMSEYGHA
ncbi:hemolysin family protein [Paenibacillus sp. J5C_2022]|uniref:hemolysin family protein n=1 Tax=Paenibacillus sp. J5C2022 TaxID=2977129 RepID=UPI0021D1932F|nr:hemolysin family protein [Paenibacillus sp. J5C2022]MCU6707229.1 hemolysin family protein [Paenibacillus sp. J5C2022]